MALAIASNEVVRGLIPSVSLRQSPNQEVAGRKKRGISDGGRS